MSYPPDPVDRGSIYLYIRTQDDEPTGIPHMTEPFGHVTIHMYIGR